MAFDRNFAAELKAALTDVRSVLDALGLLKGATRQPGGYLVRCPWHAERTPSCSVQLKDGIIQVHCFGCTDGPGEKGGSVLDLIAAVRGGGPTSRETLIEAAELAHCTDIADALQGRGLPRSPRPMSPPPRRVPTSEQAPTYPPAGEVSALWGACQPVTADAEVLGWLRSRALDGEAVALRGLARALPRGVNLPAWASFWESTQHRLIVPVYDCHGVMRSLRARRVVAVKDDPAKCIAPTGHTTRGLVMADSLALAVLNGKVPPAWGAVRVVIAEGDPDFLTWATRRQDTGAPPYATIGIVSKAWTAELAARIPNGATVTIRTDPDPSGDAYAVEIAHTLASRCTVLRPRRKP